MTSIPTMTTCRGRCDEQRPSAWSPSSPPGRSSSSPSTEPSPQPSLPGQKRMEYWVGGGGSHICMPYIIMRFWVQVRIKESVIFVITLFFIIIFDKRFFIKSFFYTAFFYTGFFIIIFVMWHFFTLAFFNIRLFFNLTYCTISGLHIT